MNVYIKIHTKDNGYLVEGFEYPDFSGLLVARVYQHQGIQSIAAMLSDIIDFLGEVGSRYDKERLYIRVEPGDKYEPASSE